ncbi:hypothetical protein MCERE10_02554 [Burkholderiaceae bacterium]
MNIELEEVVQDVSDDALELAAGGAQGGSQPTVRRNPYTCWGFNLTSVSYC